MKMNVRRECLVFETSYGQRDKGRGGWALIGERNREEKGKGRGGERDSKVKKKWCWR